MGHTSSSIGGAVCIRNGIELDFCWKQCVESLLPVCDQVVICDGESTDGTQEEIREWLKKEPKLKLCIYPWPNPKGDINFWVNWLNFAREHLRTDWHFQLDADEILHENSYDEVRRFAREGKRRTARMTRYNFWGSLTELIPNGHCLGKFVTRLAPVDVWLPSDGPHPDGAPAIRMAEDTSIRIYHYGFLRDREAFFRKERKLQEYFFNSHDARLEAMKAYEGNWMKTPNVMEWQSKLDRYEGSHPKVIHEWLKARGYHP